MYESRLSVTLQYMWTSFRGMATPLSGPFVFNMREGIQVEIYSLHYFQAVRVPLSSQGWPPLSLNDPKLGPVLTRYLSTKNKNGQATTYH